MHPTTIGLTVEDLHASVVDAGHEITRARFEHRLKHWRKWALVPKPTRQSLGRKGTRWVYPPGTERYVVVLAETSKRARRREDMAWAVWLAGMPFSAAMRPALLDKLRADEREMRAWLKEHSTDRAQSNVPRAARRRLRVGGVREKDRPLIVYVVATLLVGKRDATGALSERHRDALWAALNDVLPLPAAWKPQVAEALAVISREASIAKVKAKLRTVSAAELNEVGGFTRDAWRVLHAVRIFRSGKAAVPLFLLIFSAWSVSPTISGLIRPLVAQFRKIGIDGLGALIFKAFGSRPPGRPSGHPQDAEDVAT
jgi:hypothetical protein